MIIAINGAQYNNLTNDIILAHATYVNSPFAKVDRDLNFEKVGDNGYESDIILINDFTAEEIRSGFYEIANLCDINTLELYAKKHHSQDLDIQKYVKLQKLKENKTIKLSEFLYNDKTYQIDENSKVNLNGKVSAILLSQQTGAPIVRVSWIAKDNSITEFTTVQFLEFTNAVAQYIERVLFVNDTIRSNINKANSIKALEAISIDITI